VLYVVPGCLYEWVLYGVGVFFVLYGDGEVLVGDL